MGAERKPIVFGDLRGWIDVLRLSGELREIGADFYRLGGVCRAGGVERDRGRTDRCE